MNVINGYSSDYITLSITVNLYYPKNFEKYGKKTLRFSARFLGVNPFQTLG
jgi:hypothetical protein